ncbi:MAG: hypothetical protein LBB98_07740, partial [Treponema sp.]|nr:hypothetical protein [Treponema sp.]
PGAIVILDTVEVSKMLEIKGEDYPPIILSDDSVMSGGKLQAKEQIQIENGGTSLLKLTNNASVTLEGGLILAGLGKDATS